MYSNNEESKVNNLKDYVDGKNDPIFKIIILCGHSGSGKSYLAHKLSENGMNIPVQVTTRPPRNQKEIDDKVYEFISDEEYEAMKDDLTFRLESFNGYKYGTKLNTIVKAKNDEFVDAFDRDIMTEEYINVVVASADGIQDFVDTFYEEILTNIIEVYCIEIKDDTITEKYLKDSNRERDMKFINDEIESLKGWADVVFLNSSDNRIEPSAFYSFVENIFKTNGDILEEF